MSHAETELAKTRALAGGAVAQGTTDIDGLRATAATLNDTASSLRTIAADLGITGDGADAAWDRLVEMASNLNSQADLFSGSADAARAAQCALQAAKADFEGLPDGDIPAAEKAAIIAGGSIVGPMGTLLGMAAVEHLGNQQAEQRAEAAAKTLATLNSAMAAAGSIVPSPLSASTDRGTGAPVALPATTSGPVGTGSGSGAATATGGSGGYTATSRSTSGAYAGDAPVTGYAAGGQGSGSALGGTAVVPGAGGTAGGGTSMGGFPGTAGSGSADGSMSGTVPGTGTHSAGLGFGLGSGSSSGLTGSVSSGSAGHGAAGGALAGGLAVGGAAMGSGGLGRAGGSGLGAAGGGTGILGGGGTSSGGVGGAHAGSSGLGAGARAGSTSSLTGTSGSGLVAGSSNAATTGAGTGSRGGASMAGGMPMGGGGAAGGGSSKARRSAGGYLGPDLDIADDGGPAALGAGARAGVRGRQPDAVVAPVDLPEETW